MEEKAFFRQWCILQSIYAHANRGISLKSLAEERGVSKKTIQRDIFYLSTLSFPIYSEHDQDHNQVYYKMLSHYKFPSISLNQDEFMSLLFIFKSAFPLQAYFDGVIKDCFDKMHSQSSPELIKFYQKVWNYILPDTRASIPWSEESGKSLSQIISAILQGKKLKFKYNSIYSGKQKEHTVTVLCLKQHEHNFYIAGFSTAKNKVLIYAINRMSEAIILPEPKDHINFDAGKFFEDSFGIYPGKGFQVRLLFKKELVPYISERIWHPKQKSKVLEDGNLLLELPATSLSEIRKFVMSYGSGVKVLDPPELIDEIKKTIDEMYREYE
ncbi:MAG TPA: transcriptional regulator [Candidatus Cloacimonadota bacterium]|nr:transcriptional regulator [Candidatus Cloacimonadota bacterium]